MLSKLKQFFKGSKCSPRLELLNSAGVASPLSTFGIQSNGWRTFSTSILKSPLCYPLVALNLMGDHEFQLFLRGVM